MIETQLKKYKKIEYKVNKDSIKNTQIYEGLET